jgi:hypothetical protein
MSDAPRTVAELLSLDSEGEVASATMMASEGMRSLLDAMGDLVPPGLRQSLDGAVKRVVPSALNLPIDKVVEGGWNKIPPLLKYRDRKLYPPDQIYLVSLAEPTLTSTHHPYLELLLDQHPVKKYQLDLVLSLCFETAVLRIQDARIRAVRAGKCKGKGTLKYQEAILYERATREFTLPGEISLGEGVII